MSLRRERGAGTPRGKRREEGVVDGEKTERDRDAKADGNGRSESGRRVLDLNLVKWETPAGGGLVPEPGREPILAEERP